METTSPRIADCQDLWKNFVATHVELFERALKKLAETTEVPETFANDESAISELLILRLREVRAEMSTEDEDNVHILMPVFEAPIPPTGEAELTGGRRNKRPDFTCTFPPKDADSLKKYADSFKNYEFPLHIECKILGRDRGKQTKYKRNYVCLGIGRFDSPEHKYGRGAFSGMMLGYLIGETIESVVSGVNKCVEKHFARHPQIALSFTDGIGKCSSQFEREHVLPNSFLLQHIWVDLTAGIFGNNLTR